MAFGFNPRDAAYTQSLVNLPTYDDQPEGYVAPKPKVLPFKPLKIEGIGEIGVNQFTNAAPSAAATANAVNSAYPTLMPGMASKYNQGDVRKTEQGEYSPRAPSTAGSPPGTTGSVSPMGEPYTTRDVGGGIQRFDATGQSPLFTNLGVAGFDDMARKGPLTASAASFLGGVKEGSFAPPAARAAVDDIGGAGGDAGAIAGLTQLGLAGVQQRGIAGNWRGRMFLKQADRMTQAAVSKANARSVRMGAQARALEAQNQVPLAQMHDYTLQRGQDFGFLPHLPEYQRDVGVNTAMAGGDYEKASKIATIKSPRTGFAPRGYRPHANPVTGVLEGAFNEDTGKFTPYPTAEEIKKQQAAKAALESK